MCGTGGGARRNGLNRLGECVCVWMCDGAHHKLYSSIFVNANSNWIVSVKPVTWARCARFSIRSCFFLFFSLNATIIKANFPLCDEAAIQLTFIKLGKKDIYSTKFHHLKCQLLNPFSCLPDSSALAPRLLSLILFVVVVVVALFSFLFIPGLFFRSALLILARVLLKIQDGNQTDCLFMQTFWWRFVIQIVFILHGAHTHTHSSSGEFEWIAFICVKPNISSVVCVCAFRSLFHSSHWLYGI